MVIFLLIAVVYCLPVFQGMVVSQHDMLGTRGMTQQSFEFFEKYGAYPLWTNSMFGGMPTFQIIFAATYNIGIGWMHNLFTLFLPSPASLFFLSCISFYILSQVLKDNAIRQRIISAVCAWEGCSFATERILG